MNPQSANEKRPFIANQILFRKEFMETIKMFDKIGNFGENKDLAKKMREEILLPALEKNNAVTFDFADVSGVTQSFIHALLSEAMRKFPKRFYDNVFFKNTDDDIREIISIVYRYMQESLN